MCYLKSATRQENQNTGLTLSHINTKSFETSGVATLMRNVLKLKLCNHTPVFSSAKTALHFGGSLALVGFIAYCSGDSDANRKIFHFSVISFEKYQFQ